MPLLRYSSGESPWLVQIGDDAHRDQSIPGPTVHGDFSQQYCEHATGCRMAGGGCQT